LLTQQDYVAAISLLKQIILENSQELLSQISLLSLLGRIYLLSGNERMAFIINEKVEKLHLTLSDKEKQQTEIVVMTNKALFNLACNNFKEALQIFESGLSLEPNNLILHNNTCISKLYSGNLSEAIKLLENTLQNDPKNNLEEVLVKNISTLYDLASENSQEKKKEILKLITKFSSDITWN